MAAKAKPVGKELAVLNPLTVNDIALAHAIVDSSRQLISFWGKCTNCTMDVGPMIEQAKSHLAFAEGVITEFSKGAKDG